jgi:hypothetical protein
MDLFYRMVQPFMDTIDNGGGASTTSDNTGNVQTNAPASEPVTPPTPITEFDIDGIGKVKVDDIKEWKLGYMRQSDYTRKTQEIARQRNETKDALDVYNFLKSNPTIAQALADGDT